MASVSQIASKRGFLSRQSYADMEDEQIFTVFICKVEYLVTQSAVFCSISRYPIFYIFLGSRP
jgi:hypothetical protein